MEAGSDTPSGPAWTASASGTMQARSLSEAIMGPWGRPGLPSVPSPSSHSGKAGTAWGAGGSGRAQSSCGPGGHLGPLGAAGRGAVRVAAGSGAHLSTSPDRYLSATLRMRLWTWLKLEIEICELRLYR